jgi:hypothetical protein
MKDIVRLGVLSALLFATSLPAFSAPSDSDMGFASREPTAADVGYKGLMTRGIRNPTDQIDPYAGASAGDAAWKHRTDETTDKTWFDGQNRETKQYLINLPYRANTQNGSQSKQHSFQQMTQGKTQVNMMAGFGEGSVGMRPLALRSVSGLSIQGPQNSGMRPGPLGFGTLHGLRLNGAFLPQTGMGSVNASICAPDGKQ